MERSDYKSCSLRPLGKEDLNRVLVWRNHPDIRRYMFSQHEITESEHSRWYERASRDAAKELLIFEVNKVAKGFIQFDIDDLNNCADWGFYMSPTATKGFGFNMGQLGLEYAFNQLKLHKLCGQAIAFNLSSIRFHLSLGFSQEGVRRKQYLNDKKYYDISLFGLLKVEWDNKDCTEGIIKK